MTQTEESPAYREQQCQAAVERFLTHYHCQLLTHTEFVRRTLEHLQQGLVDDPYKAATGVYSLTLYTACSGAEGQKRQERGYEELFYYLRTIAAWRYPEGADDVTQSALVAIFERFERCQHPIAFLAFAFQQLLTQTKKLRRQDRRQGEALDEELLHTLLPTLVQDEPLEQALAEDLRARVQQEFVVFRRAYPKASKQIDALEMKYLQGLDDEAISKALGCSVKSVYERRARACQKLRADARWRLLAIACGLLPPDV